jgi:hypothetical protein
MLAPNQAVNVLKAALWDGIKAPHHQGSKISCDQVRVEASRSGMQFDIEINVIGLKAPDDVVRALVGYLSSTGRVLQSTWFEWPGITTPIWGIKAEVPVP